METQIRTHKCTKCLMPTPADEYFRNDHICDLCVLDIDEFRLASTEAVRTKESGAHEH